MEIRIKRVYDPVARSDGLRVLVDRLWPRGLTKQAASVDLWAKHLSPSPQLRRWFDHQAERFAEFARRYCRELSEGDFSSELTALADSDVVTLLYAARDPLCNHALVLQGWLRKELTEDGDTADGR